MIIEHFSEDKDIDEDTVIWRYRSFKRFKQLLKEESLHFHRIDDFADPFEGSIPKLVDDIRETHATEREARVDQALNRRLRQHTFANCWHMKERESANMWDNYGGDKNVIAIKSTVGQLEEAIVEPEEDYLQLADIRYIDFIDTTFEELSQKVPSGNQPSQWTIVKRASFKEESEFRAFIQTIPKISESEYAECEYNLKTRDIEEKIGLTVGQEEEYIDLRSAPSQFGQTILVDPDILLDGIFVDPEAEEEYVEMVKYTADNFGVDPDLVEHSSLSSDAIY